MTEEESIAKIAHQYEAVVTPPTCKDDGFTTHTCKVCKDTYKDSKTPAGTHAFGEWVTVKEATCLEAGYTKIECANCHDVKSTTVIPSLNHSWNYDECGEAVCSRCGEEKRRFQTEQTKVNRSFLL
jgi:hypothetical protein